MRKSMMIFAATLTAVLVTQTGCKKDEYKDPRTLPDLVRLTPVGSARGRVQSYTGVIAARVESNLGFRVSGKVTQRLVDEGQSVHKGQPLMRIDVTDYTLAISAETEAVAAARARSEQAVADEARYRGLVATGAVSASAYDLVKASADAAKAQLSEAQARLKVAVDEGDYSVLLADADGVITQTLVEPGQVVAAGQVVLKLAHAGSREAAVYLPETVRPHLDSHVMARLYGKPTVFDARLRQLADSADSQTRTFEARYVLAGDAARAPLGATVTVDLPSQENGSGMYVPLAAITDRAGGPGVWQFISDSSTVAFRPVTITKLSGEEAEVASGVAPGDQIVAVGAHLLSNGQHVRVAHENVGAQ
jgi:RND family efflux transporter MFP subunit